MSRPGVTATELTLEAAARPELILSSRGMGLIETTDEYAEQARAAIGEGLP